MPGLMPTIGLGPNAGATNESHHARQRMFRQEDGRGPPCFQLCLIILFIAALRSRPRHAPACVTNFTSRHERCALITENSYYFDALFRPGRHAWLPYFTLLRRARG